MKKKLSILLIGIICVLALCSCGEKKKEYKISELEKISEQANSAHKEDVEYLTSDEIKEQRGEIANKYIKKYKIPVGEEITVRGKYNNSWVDDDGKTTSCYLCTDTFDEERFEQLQNYTLSCGFDDKIDFSSIHKGDAIVIKGTLTQFEDYCVFSLENCELISPKKDRN